MRHQLTLKGDSYRLKARDLGRVAAATVAEKLGFVLRKQPDKRGLVCVEQRQGTTGQAAGRGIDAREGGVTGQTETGEHVVAVARWYDVESEQTPQRRLTAAYR